MFPRRPFLREIVALGAALAALGFLGYELSSGPSASAGRRQLELRIVQVASGLDSPLHVAAPRNERGRIYIVLQGGKIVVFENGRVRDAAVPRHRRARCTSGGEQGLLSVAFHPRYAQNRLFYVNYTDNNGHTRIVEYRSNGQKAVKRVRQLLFMERSVLEPQRRPARVRARRAAVRGHGRRRLPAATPRTARRIPGSLLRQAARAQREQARREVADRRHSGCGTPGASPSIGPRGALYIGDVGQGDWEEIDYTPRRSPGLENYGWDVYEGRAVFEQKGSGRAGSSSPCTSTTAASAAP